MKRRIFVTAMGLTAALLLVSWIGFFSNPQGAIDTFPFLFWLVVTGGYVAILLATRTINLRRWRGAERARWDKVLGPGRRRHARQQNPDQDDSDPADAEEPFAGTGNDAQPPPPPLWEEPPPPNPPLPQPLERVQRRAKPLLPPPGHVSRPSPRHSTGMNP